MNFSYGDEESRFEIFLSSIESNKTDELMQLEREAIEDDVPIIRRATQSLLRVILAAHRPGRILEIGAAVGFSALFMAEYDDDLKELITIENYPPRIEAAKENFKKFKKEDLITLIERDAAEVLSELTGTFDLIFLDGPKAQYINFLPELTRLLETGGILVSDNVLKEGDILMPHYAIKKRDRTIHKRMREYLYELTHSECFVTTILSAGDGTAISVKKDVKDDTPDGEM